MAFCKYCGKRLEDGEVCNCQENSTEEKKGTSPTVETALKVDENVDSSIHKGNDTKEKTGLIEEVKDYIISYWNNPEDTIRTNMTSDSWRLTIVHVLIRAVMISIIMYKGLVEMTEDVKDYIVKVIQDTEGELSNLLDMFASKLGSLTSIVDEFFAYAGDEVVRNIDITFSAEDTIIYSAVFSIVLSSIVILVLFCIAKIQKSEVTFPMVVKANIANGMYITGALIIIAILSFLDVYTAMMLLVLPVIAWPICGTMVAPIVCEYNTERKKGFQLIYILGVIAVFAITVYFVPSFVEKIYGSITFDLFGQKVSIGDLFK